MLFQVMFRDDEDKDIGDCSQYQEWINSNGKCLRMNHGGTYKSTYT